MTRKKEEKISAVEDAKTVGLRYVTDSTPGISRKKKGSSFIYFNQSGKQIKDEKTLTRIRKLVIPPAWKNVWISVQANSHLQATGRDARGRKQYKYHTNWRQIRDENKYGKLISFAKSLPLIRKKTDEHLRLSGLPKQKVTAIVVQLLEQTSIRIGNEEYARDNKSFGLTTFKDNHVDINGGKIVFEFRGKSGKMHKIGLHDKRLAKLVKSCRDLPGQELFQYIDENKKHQSIGSLDVNEYLREISKNDFTAKDFRTWAGTVMMCNALCAFENCKSETESKRNITEAIKQVAESLGNTPAICRKCYIHPAIIDLYSSGELQKKISGSGKNGKSPKYSLSSEEKAVLAILSSINK